MQLEKYQEQPTLLDSHLPQLVGALMLALRKLIASGVSDVSGDPKALSIFKTVYLVCKVRGSTIVGAFFGPDFARSLTCFQLQLDYFRMK